MTERRKAPYDANKLLKQFPHDTVLEWDRENAKHDEIDFDISKYAFIDDEGWIHLSGEREHSQTIVCDYYGEFRGGYPWISPKLEEWAEEKDLYWDWDNPGSIMLCE